MTERIGLANQLRASLESFWPGAATIFPEIDSVIALAFIKRYPTPGSAARLGQKRLSAFLTSQGYTGQSTAAYLLERLRGAPISQVGDCEARAKGTLVCMLASILSELMGQLAALKALIEQELSRLPDGQILMSFPRAGRLNAAQILSELGSVRERFPSEAQLASEAGVCPVTYQSGKSRGVRFRWACNQRLRTAITIWANNSRKTSKWADSIYSRARERGARHPHAVRILARAWIRILWRAWHERVGYEPLKHRGAQQFAPSPQTS
jgi:transposase